ncbi:NAD(P)H-binding protein [Carboxylicivirga sp. N1Y90]|uniref:NAD(P)H-binding protein n=1 Tax=Carboxylicivirga fragile TaxID=3417571 RepID=UPI003D347F68|nr:NAD(P)H-binding protein [Marinilabiliaceae bacterium N1Y90]
MKTALIAGATGLIGQAILKQLLDCKRYHKVIALVRRPLDLNHPKLEELEIDFNQVDNFKASEAVTDVFCCLGTTIKTAGSKEAFTKVDYTYVVELANWAKQNGSQLFSVVSSVGATPNTSNFYLLTKGKMETEVSSIGLETVHIFRPSLLIGKRNEFRFGEKVSEVLMTLFQPLLVGRFRKFRAIKANEVALAMCKRAQSEEKGKFIFEGDQIC